jgi:hypothetical protein
MLEAMLAGRPAEAPPGVAAAYAEVLGPYLRPPGPPGPPAAGSG